MPTRTFLPLIMGTLMTLSNAADAQQVDVWLGTTTPRDGQSRGIYHTTLDIDNGKLGPVTLAAEISNPGFLERHPSAPRLYSTGSVDGKAVVAAFEIQNTGGQPSLKLINSVPIPGGGGAAHLALDRTGKLLMTAQYGAGSTALFELDENLGIARHVQTVEHQGGSGVVERRQDSPHAHWAGTSPDNRFVFVPDLGLDQVVIYKLSTDPPSLEPHGHGEVPPGGGPRHMKFHPNGKFIYVLNELALSVTTFAYDAEEGTMKPLQTVPTVPQAEKDKEQFVSASEIRVHPSGKFVYAANRGHDTITAFSVDQGSGKLTEIEREPIRGSWPRNFNLDPTGRWLLAAGRDSNTLTVFEVDPQTGELTYARVTAAAPTPICVVFGETD